MNNAVLEGIYSLTASLEEPRRRALGTSHSFEIDSLGDLSVPSCPS